MKRKNLICPLCDSNDAQECATKPSEITFEGKQYIVPRIATTCKAGDCGFSWLAPGQHDRNIDVFWEIANSIDGYFDKSNVLTIRETYEIDHADAGAAFGISKDQYRMYETGTLEVPRELGIRMQRALDEPEYFVDLLVEVWRKTK